MYDPVFYLQQGLHGLVYGMLLFLATSGLTLAFGMMRILNIAHAGFYMLGAYLAFTIAQRTNVWVAFLVPTIAVGIVGALFERTMLRRVGTLGHVYELLLTFGIFFVIQEAVLWIWGSYPLRVAMPSLLSGSIRLLDFQYPIYRLFVLACSLAVCAVMVLVFLRTKIGIIVRATVSDAGMVSALGVNTSLVRAGVFSAGAALAGFAGAIAAPLLQADPGMGRGMLLDGFIVVVLGGFGSLVGALIAALALGQLQAFGVAIFPEVAVVLPYVLMIGVLMVRPHGLFGVAS